MNDSIMLPGLDEAALARLAEMIAFAARPGDLVALSGVLGAGKTTFARAFIASMTHPVPTEVPSPTFMLVQTYETPRFAIAHYDLYRVETASEIAELGLEDALGRGIALVEWPERLQGSDTAAAADARLDITLGDGANAHAAETRDARLLPAGSWGPRLARLLQIRCFLGQPEIGAGRDGFVFLQGDASVRRYARLIAPASAPARATRLLMDWARQPDGPPVRKGKPYSRLAHLAEDARPFVAIGRALAQAGVRVPKVEAFDVERGLLVLEDLGDGVFSRLSAPGTQPALWQSATDALVALRRASPNPPAVLPLPGAGEVALPALDRGLLEIETELLIDWTWPLVHGAAAPEAERRRYRQLWAPVFDSLLALPRGWMLRDYHSPNLILVAGGAGRDGVGVIDFQDAIRGPWAYDLVSLLQDARVDVPRALEAALFDRYCAGVAAFEPGFDSHAFGEAYAALGLERNTKILGIFARLAQRDAKPAYLAHMPRIWGYVGRALEAPHLEPLGAWFSRAFPPQSRGVSP